MKRIKDRAHALHSAARQALLLGASCALLALTACGGSGGGADAGSSEAAQVTLSANVFPLAVGDRRIFQVTSGSNVGEVRTQRITETTLLDGRTVFVDRDQTGDISYVTKTATALTYYPGPAADGLDKELGPFDTLRFGQVAGETVAVVDRTLAVDVNGDGSVDSVEIRWDVTFVGYEDVTTSLGTFKAAAHLRSVIRSTNRYAGQTGAQAYAATLDHWHAPGVGLVRSTSSGTVDGGAPFNDVEELTAYSVGGLRAGNVASALIDSYPKNDASVNWAAAIELNYDEPLNPSTLGRPGGPTLVNAAGQAIPSTLSLSPNGLKLILTPVSPLAEGAYEVRTGSAVTDLLGNTIAQTTRKFVLDRTGPRVVSTSPARNATAVPLTGEVVIRFSEPVFADYGTTVQLQLTAINAQTGALLDSRLLPAVIRGNEVVATVTAPLLRNTDYVLSSAPGTLLRDAAGNLSDVFLVQNAFKTVPNP